MKTLMVTKSNALIQASYQLSLNELRIVLYGLAQINPTATEFPLFHRVLLKEMADFYSIAAKDRCGFYQNIKEALLTKFWERDISYYDKALNEIVKRRWLIEVRHGQKEGALAYHYNPLIQKQLQQLASRFTSYLLCNIANMKSVYGIRLYEIAIMNFNVVRKTVMDFTQNIQELKRTLGIEDKYKNFHDFKRRVLDAAQRDINDHSDIDVTWQSVNQGRKVTHIQMCVTRPVTEHLTAMAPPCHITTNVIEQAKKIITEAGTRWDIYAILNEFFDYARKKGTPHNPSGAFINFTKKKVLQRP